MSKRKVPFSELEDPDFEDLGLNVRPGQVWLWRGGRAPCRVRIVGAVDGYPGMWHVRPVEGGDAFSAGEHDFRRV